MNKAVKISVFLLGITSFLQAGEWVSYQGQLVPESWVPTLENREDKKKEIISNLQKKYLQFKMKKEFSEKRRKAGKVFSENEHLKILKKKMAVRSNAVTTPPESKAKKEPALGDDKKIKLNQIIKKYLGQRESAKQKKSNETPLKKLVTTKKAKPQTVDLTTTKKTSLIKKIENILIEDEITTSGKKTLDFNEAKIKYLKFKNQTKKRQLTKKMPTPEIIEKTTFKNAAAPPDDRMEISPTRKRFLDIIQKYLRK